MKSFAERLREDRRLVILRLLSETRGFTLNSSQVQMGLEMVSVPCTRADVIEDLRFLANNGLIRMTPVPGIENLYGVVRPGPGISNPPGGGIYRGVPIYGGGGLVRARIARL